MEKVRVSVVIPFFSNIEWLFEAIDSVLKQSYYVDEIIVVNDGSKEDLSRLDLEYGSRVTVFNQPNQGAASARNNGIKKATGQYIFFLDSDDVWDSTKVEKQLNYMLDNGFSWSCTYYDTFGSGKKKTIKQKLFKGLCWKKLYNTCSIQTSTVAVKKEVLEKTSFNETMKYGEDIFLWFKIANHYPLGVLKEALVHYRLRGSNAHLQIGCHIESRHELYSCMTSGAIFSSKRFLTSCGYKLCSTSYKMFVRNKKKAGFFSKLCFLIAWLLFRVDNFIQR